MKKKLLLLLIVLCCIAGPFTVTSQSTTGINYQGGSSQTITCNVNYTTALASLSTDAGLTFTTTLASGVSNNGSAKVTIPNISASNCRIMIKPNVARNLLRNENI